MSEEALAAASRRGYAVVGVSVALGVSKEDLDKMRLNAAAAVAGLAAGMADQALRTRMNTSNNE